ncbi:DUF2007 domain-containing protein [uncultured Muribaculum sp.]|uniref:putative signal transducing protein n=1 Tax=uncultured Muribaculum sp. TaxID=1918613 RepID=UPI0025FF1E59|nr:DUF2007 domain-containing protein [uncultured Muribaculum sp.]
MEIQANIPGNDLVLFNEYANSADAYIVKGVLDTNGVPSIVDNSIMGTLLGGITAVGSFRLMVRRKDLDIARRIMSDPTIHTQ